ncbi:MAG: hypothetical protein Q7K39_02340 [Candidatus Magasanikbacteria bacterium]|nr:hypothetical protein [Candidatus Magasanikbacteria bacterium]
MNPNLKRILQIAGLVATTILIAWGIYRVFFKQPSPVSERPGGEGETPPGAQLPPSGERAPGAGVEPGVTGALPPSAGTGPTLGEGAGYFQQEPVQEIFSDFAAFPSASAEGEVRFHNVSDGKFYRVGADGKIQTLSDQVFFNVENATWAKTANKAVLAYPDGSKIIYNFDLQKQVSLPKHWEEFSFSPDASQVAAKSIGLATENRWLVTVNDDGTGTRLIEPLGDNANKVIVDWSPSRQTVALAQTGQALGADRREVLFVGLNGENFKSTVVEGIDFQPQWSPTGNRLLYSVDSARSDFKPELWIVDAFGDNIGNNRRLLKLNTWAKKCTFGNEDTLFCAVPQTLPQGAGMSPEIAASTPDDLVKIDLRTGLRTDIPTGGGKHMDTVSYDSKNNKIIFTDNQRAGVFQVNL